MNSENAKNMEELFEKLLINNGMDVLSSGIAASIIAEYIIDAEYENAFESYREGASHSLVVHFNAVKILEASKTKLDIEFRGYPPILKFKDK